MIKNDDVSNATEIIVGIILGAMVSAVVMPIIWYLSRMMPLILHGLFLIFRGLVGVMFLGGMVLGAVVGASFMAIVVKKSQLNRFAVMGGAIGGMVGGLCSSVIFFPIFVIVGSS